MSGNTMHQPGQIPGNPMQKFGQGSMGFRNPNEGGMLEGPGGSNG